MSPHRSGGKFASSHTTVIDAAEELVDAAIKLSEVTKISLGEIKVIGSGMRNMKFMVTDSGLKAVVRGNTTKQSIYIYSTNIEKTRNDLAKFEQKRG